MDRNSKQHLDLFRLLVLLDKKKASLILKQGLNKRQVKVIAELAANLLAGNIKIKDSDKNLLLRYKTFIRKLGCKKCAYATRRDLVRNNSVAVLSLLKAILKYL